MTVTAEGGAGMSPMFKGTQIPVTGTNGSISLGPVTLQTWLIAVLSLVGCLGAVLRSKGVISVGKFPILIATGITAPFAIMGLFLSLAKAFPEVGIWLVNIAILASVWFAWKAMKSAEQGVQRDVVGAG